MAIKGINLAQFLNMQLNAFIQTYNLIFQRLQQQFIIMQIQRVAFNIINQSIIRIENMEVDAKTRHYRQANKQNLEYNSLAENSKQWIKNYVNQRQKNRILFSSSQANISSKLNSITDILKSSLSTPPPPQSTSSLNHIQKNKQTAAKSSKTINSKKTIYRNKKTYRKVTQESDQMFIKKLDRMVQSVNSWELSLFAQFSKPEKQIKMPKKRTKFQKIQIQQNLQDKQTHLRIQNQLRKMKEYVKCDIYCSNKHKPKIVQQNKIEKLKQFNQKLKRNAQNMGIKFAVKSQRNAIQSEMPQFYLQRTRISQKLSNIKINQQKLEQNVNQNVHNYNVPQCFMQVLSSKRINSEKILQIVRKGYKTSGSNRRVRYVGL